MYVRLMSPVRTASLLSVGKIVDPDDMWRFCCRWTKEMYGLPMQERLGDKAAMMVVAVFS